jgi:hypothetical protein
MAKVTYFYDPNRQSYRFEVADAKGVSFTSDSDKRRDVENVTEHLNRRGIVGKACEDLITAAVAEGYIG